MCKASSHYSMRLYRLYNFRQLFQRYNIIILGYGVMAVTQHFGCCSPGSNPGSPTKFIIGVFVHRLGCGPVTAKRRVRFSHTPQKNDFMVVKDIKDIVKGSASLTSVKAGGICQYLLKSSDGSEYLLDIDVSDKKDVGESCEFEVEYEKALFLMRWIRRANEEDTLVKLR